MRETLAGIGLSEAVTFALVSPAMVERFGPIDDALVPGEGQAGGRPLTVTNPLSSQHSVLRQSLIGSLLEVVSTNTRFGRPDVAIFEVGKGYGATEEGDSTHEWWRLGLALTGAADVPTWDRPARPYDLDDAKGIIELIAERLGFARPSYSPIEDDPNLHPGRAARVIADGQIAGRVGEVHPSVIDELELRVDRILVAELAVAGLSGGQPDTPRVSSPSRHPIVDRDLAVIVADATPAGEVEAVDPAPRRSAPAHGDPVRHLPRAATGRRGEEPRVSIGVRGGRPDAGRERGRQRRGRHHGGSRERRRGPTQDLAPSPKVPDGARGGLLATREKPLLPLRGSRAGSPARTVTKEVRWISGISPASRSPTG